MEYIKSIIWKMFIVIFLLSISYFISNSLKEYYDNKDRIYTCLLIGNNKINTTCDLFISDTVFVNFNYMNSWTTKFKLGKKY